MTDIAEYRVRHGIHASRVLTMGTVQDTEWVVQRIAPVIADRTVVEIGAGVGVLAMEMAKHAKHVFAIEADPQFTAEFVVEQYAKKPLNLTWVFDRAQSLVGVIRSDVAVVLTGSDEEGLRRLAEQFAPVVVMPWQDWKGGKALVSNRGLRGEMFL